MHSTTVEESNEDTVNTEINTASNENNIEENVEKEEEKENILQFGENLDIPTFLRNRKI